MTYFREAAGSFCGVLCGALAGGRLDWVGYGGFGTERWGSRRSLLAGKNSKDAALLGPVVNGEWVSLVARVRRPAGRPVVGRVPVYLRVIMELFGQAVGRCGFCRPTTTCLPLKVTGWSLAGCA